MVRDTPYNMGIYKTMRSIVEKFLIDNSFSLTRDLSTYKGPVTIASIIH